MCKFKDDSGMQPVNLFRMIRSHLGGKKLQPGSSEFDSNYRKAVKAGYECHFNISECNIQVDLKQHKK